MRSKADETFVIVEVRVSFDVVSLFTNVPLTETINLIADYDYAETNDSIPFTKDIFIKLMNLATLAYLGVG